MSFLPLGWGMLFVFSHVYPALTYCDFTQFMNVATIAFDVLRSVSFALTMSFPMCVRPTICSAHNHALTFIHRVSDAAASIFNVMNDYLASRAYSRKLEEEADALGLEVSRPGWSHFVTIVLSADSWNSPSSLWLALDSILAVLSTCGKLWLWWSMY